MTDPDQIPATTDLVTLEADLAEHVVDLLAAAGVLALDRPAGGGLATVVVRDHDVVTARATLDLVLPGLLAEESGELLDDEPVQPLSGRLVRRGDWPDGDPDAQRGLVDGRAAFSETLDAVDDMPVRYAEDDGDFTPQPPPPLPRGDTVSRFAWFGVVAGPLLLLVTGILHLPGFLAAIGLGAFVAGFGVLIARMPDRARQDDGWDDGAVL